MSPQCIVIVGNHHRFCSASKIFLGFANFVSLLFSVCFGFTEIAGFRTGGRQTVGDPMSSRVCRRCSFASEILSLALRTSTVRDYFFYVPYRTVRTVPTSSLLLGWKEKFVNNIEFSKRKHYKNTPLATKETTKRCSLSIQQALHTSSIRVQY